MTRTEMDDLASTIVTLVKENEEFRSAILDLVLSCPHVVVRY
jgi:hypothetical protein